MTWVKLDDQFFRNPKAQAVGRDGRELYLAGLCYCAGQLTDGKIPKAVVAILCTEAGVRAAVTAGLVQHGLWADYGDHYQVHDWERYNPPAERVKAERERAADRQRKARSRRESRRDDSVTDGVSSAAPTRPSRDVPSGTSLAQETLNAYWESCSPKPASPYIGLLKICERLVDAGWSQSQVAYALQHAQAHTINAMEFVLRGANGSAKKPSVGDRNIALLRGDIA